MGVENWLKIPTAWEKCQKTAGGGGLTHTHTIFSVVAYGNDRAM